MKKKSLLKSIIAFMLVIAMITGVLPLPGVTMVAQAGTASDVSYIDEEGETKTCASATVFTGSEGDETLSDGWYVVKADVTIVERISVSGSVNLILGNGATLTASKGITVGSDATLNVYAQTNDEETMGALVADATNDSANWYAGIGGVENEDAGTITINGGKINATGWCAAGIGSGGGTSTVGTITINGGVVTAQDNAHYGAGIGGGFSGGKASTINLSGGVIHAAGIGSGENGGNCSITVNISDGIKKIEATSFQGGACIGNGKSASGTVTVNFKSGDNVVTGDAKDDVFYDSGEGSERRIYVKASSHTVTVNDDLKANITSDKEYALTGETVTLTLDTSVDATMLKVNDGAVSTADAGNRQHTFTMPDGNVTVTATLLSTYAVTLPSEMELVSATNAADAGGKYITGTVVTFKVSFPYAASNVSDGTNALTATDGVYSVTIGTAEITVTADFERSNPINLSDAPGNFAVIDGDVLTGSTSHTVTIADGANITLNNATITGGIVCNGTATITLVGDNTVTGAIQKAGIQIGGSDTTLTIRGNGSLTANGGQWSAGIGLSCAWDPANDVIGGDIVIEGGNITANGGSQWGAGIGTGVIYGHGNAKTARIGNITIKGGSVKATGGSDSDGIGTGYTYSGCTNAIGTVTIYDSINMVDATSIKDFANLVYMHGETNVTASKNEYFTISGNGDHKIITPPHTHSFTYSAAGATITAACSKTNCPLTDHKVILTITAPTGNLAYNGSARAATLTGLGTFNTATGLNIAESGITYYAATKNGDTYTKSGSSLTGAPTGAGDYVAEITLQSKTASVGYTIAPKEISLNWENTAFTYDGNEHCPTATVGGLMGGDTCTVTIIGGKTNAGNYTATASGLSNSNYKLPEVKAQAFTIAKADIDSTAITTPAAKTLTYDGTSQELVTAGTAIGGTMQYALGNATAATEHYTTSIPTATDAGTYHVWYKVIGDNNHKNTDPVKVDVRIGQSDNPAVIQPTVTVKKGTGIDLSTLVKDAQGTVTFAKNGDEAGYTLGADGKTLTLSDTATGTCTISVNVAETSNYKNKTGSIVVTATDKDTQTLTFAEASVTKVYGDTDFTNMISGAKTEVTYCVESGEDFVTVNENTGRVTILKAGKAVIKATAAESEQFAAASVMYQLTVNKAKITVAAKNQSIYVNDTVPSLDSPILGTHYTVSGLKAGENLGGTVSMKYQKDGADVTPDASTAGTYDIVISGAIVPTGGNYEEEITYTKGTLTISARSGGGSDPGTGGSGTGGSGSGGSGGSGSGGGSDPTPTSAPSSSAAPSPAPSAAPSAAPTTAPVQTPMPPAPTVDDTVKPVATPSAAPVGEPTTTTETGKDGTETETKTTTYTDGSMMTEEKITKPDGTVTEKTEVVSPDGSKASSEVTMETDGTKIEKAETVSADGNEITSKEVVTEASGAKTITENIEKTEGALKSTEETVQTVDADGKVTEVIRHTTEENTETGKKTEKETIWDETGEVATTKTVETEKVGKTTVVDTVIENKDGSSLVSTVSTTDKGRETSRILETAASGNTTLTEQVKQPSGDYSKVTLNTTLKKDEAGKITGATVTIDTEVKTGKITQKASFVLLNIGNNAKKSSLNSLLKKAAKSTNAVALTKATTTKKNGTITIEKTVKADGKTYTVTTLKKGLLKKNKTKPKKVTIRPTGITKVEKGAFNNLAKKATIKIQAGKKDFKRIKKLITKSGLPKGVKIKRIK